MTTIDQILSLAPKANVKYMERVIKTYDTVRHVFHVTTNYDHNHFIAQAAHETGGFRWFTELASGKAYEGRSDLGNVHPGDGPRFKGRGIFQATGRYNYRLFTKIVVSDSRFRYAYVKLDFVANSLDFEANPVMLAQPEWATLYALYYWDSRNLEVIADDPRLTDEEKLRWITKRINGGYNGYDDRLRYYLRAKQIWND